MATRTHLKRTSSIVVVAFASMLLAATASLAQEYPPGVPFGFACAPESPAVGDTVECGVVGAQPGETLTATAEYNPVFFETELTASDEGTAAFSFEVPAEAEGEQIIVTVVGSESGTLSVELEVVEETTAPPSDPSDPSDPSAPAPGDDLPRTGMESSTLLAAGGALLLLGAGTVLAARRRDRSRVDA